MTPDLDRLQRLGKSVGRVEDGTIRPSGRGRDGNGRRIFHQEGAVKPLPWHEPLGEQSSSA